MYQILIRNASVIDGTGKPAFSADVAVKDGKIVLNPDPVLGAEEVIDAAGLVLSPGFIDAHCHGDSSLGIPEACLAKSSQGICTDSFDIGPDKACHPRCFGSFPLCLGKYVREQKLMPLETMIHKMTQAPAEFMGIANKGVIADGYDADLVLFNPDTVIDKADFKNSHTLSEGIERVFVAGETVFTNGKLTGKFPGKFIPHQK